MSASIIHSSPNLISLSFHFMLLRLLTFLQSPITYPMCPTMFFEAMHIKILPILLNKLNPELLLLKSKGDSNLARPVFTSCQYVFASQ